ncbi:MAG: FtsQ-type POTRA domain-containing protein [Chloroflexi bacterium]|nr:FtsQ-type POTRA domain-containing protein [Chloroflexota bacterium]
MSLADSRALGGRRVGAGRAGRRQSGAWALAQRLAYATMGAALGGLSAWLGVGDALHVRDVAVYGTRLLSAEEVVAQLDAEGRHVLWLRQGELEARLAALPEVQAAQVEVFAPGVIEVTVSERRPALVWVVAGEEWLVDEQGLALRRSAGAWPGLPVVHQIGGRGWSRGHQLDPRVVGNALRLAQFVTRTFPPDTRLLYHEATGLVVFGPGWQALFDPGGDLAWQQAALRALQARPDLAGPGGAMYDVRFPDRAYVRPLPAGGGPAAERGG